MRIPLYRLRIDTEVGPVVERRIFTLPKADTAAREMLCVLLRDEGWSLFISLVEERVNNLIASNNRNAA